MPHPFSLKRFSRWYRLLLGREKLLERRSASRRRQPLRLEELEPRVCPASDLVVDLTNGNHHVALVQVNNGGNTDPTDDQIEVVSDMTVLGSKLVNDTSGVRILGASADDTVTIDPSFSSSGALLKPVFFDGNGKGLAGDTLNGPNIATSWTVAAASPPTPLPAILTLTTLDVENLHGGSGNDSYQIS